MASLADVPADEPTAAQAEGIALVLCNVEGEILALEDVCSHQKYPLSTGELEEGVLTCQWHGARFDAHTGQALSLPAIDPVCTFPVRVVDGEIYVRTAGREPAPGSQQ